MEWFFPGYSLYHQNPKFWWPELLPSTEYADFSYDATNDVDFNGGDSIVSLSLSVAPSGEAVPSRLELVSPALIAVWITGGYPGRIYQYQLIITTQMIRQIPIIIGQKCSK